jgi:diacylglycerol kinase family enzyme
VARRDYGEGIIGSSWLAIINPRAGPFRTARWRRALAERARQALGAEVVFTQSPGHATALAASAQTVEGLAVFGGDGTLAEVVNGMNLERQKLLMLAGGTGNGLARDLGLTSLEAAFAAARAGRVRQLDLVRVTFRQRSEEWSRLAISTASVGYAAEVVLLSNRFFKWLGALCYPLAATLQAARQTTFPLVLRLDDNAPAEQRLSNVMVNNTRHAGNFSAFRRSDPGDGQMEVLLARAGFGAQLLHNLAVLTRTYFYATAAEVTARTLTLDLPQPQRLMIDGELWEEVSRVRFEILPGKLRCLA